MGTSTIRHVRGREGIGVLREPGGRGSFPVICTSSHRNGSGMVERLARVRVSIGIRSVTITSCRMDSRMTVREGAAGSFISSVVSGELFGRTHRLSRRFGHPLLVLRKSSLCSNVIGPGTVEKSLTSVTVSFNVDVVPAEGTRSATTVVGEVTIHRRGKREAPVRVEASGGPIDVLRRRLFVIRSLPGVNPMGTGGLLTRFNDINGVVGTDRGRLRRIRNVNGGATRGVEGMISSGCLCFRGRVGRGELL